MKSNSSNNTPFSRNPLPEVKSVGEISFNELKIPPYQRPYKWTSKNVNQLITDIITFRNKKQYRLGTLVLYKNEIVDGQQRIITLTLLIKKMYDKLQDKKKKDFYETCFSIIILSKNIKLMEIFFNDYLKIKVFDEEEGLISMSPEFKERYITLKSCIV